MRVHAVTFDALPDAHQLAEWAALSQRIDRLHLRFPDKHAADVYRLTDELLRRGAVKDKLVMHDRLDVALLLDLPAVQCGYRSPPVAIIRNKYPQLTIGASVHSVEEAVQADRAGADYVLFGHVFPTASKAGRPAKGLALLHKVARCVRVPVIAIGGITPSHIKDVAAAGARGVAVQSGIFRADAPLAAAQAYIDAAQHISMHKEEDPC